MRLPQPYDYHQVVHRPDLVFADADLKNCRTEVDPMGRPRVSSGGFALTYRLLGPNGEWAVRCFHRPVPDRERRYQAISCFLISHPNPIFTPISYLATGIRVNGQWYPVTKMRWLPGETLGLFIERNISSPGVIGSLAVQFRGLVATLESMGIAHGDLQHGNIMVSNGKLTLIDYDGLYVPELASLSSSEHGHVNYQHPARTERDFGPHLDRFSSLVIYMALQALPAAPYLWQTYAVGGENLLFKQADFRSPDTSKLLENLETIPALQPLVQRFRVVCKGDIAQVPRLEDFLAGQMRGVAPIDWVPAPLRRQYRVIRAEQRSKLLESVGQRVTVIGRILHTPSRATGRPYVFLSFGDTTQGCFTLVIWSEGLQLFEAQKKNPSDYKGKWVSVTGLLARYDPADRPPHPQIVVQMPSEIEVLAGGEEEARERLRTRPGQQPATRPPSTSRTFSDPYRYWTVPVAQAGARSGASKPSIPAGQRTTLVHPPSQRPQLTVSETSIDLGEVQSARTEEAMIGVSNSGTGLLRATVTKVPPWLSVSPKQLTCAPGTTQWITISLQSTVAPTQSIRSDAITIQSNGGSAFISVRVQVVAPVLQIDTKRVRISLDREGAGRAIVKVTNSGSGLLEVKADPPVGFQSYRLDISPSRVSCTAGQSKSFSVRLRVPDPSPGTPLPQGTLIFRSNGGDEEITVTAEMTDPWLLVAPAAIDLGRYEKAGPAPIGRLRIENAGGGVLEGQIEIQSRKEWLTIGATSFRLLGGESTDIGLDVISEAARLRHPAVIRRPLSATIWVESNGGRFALPVEMVSVYRG